ncbi:TolC family protein [Sulfurivermis fontis]|uniref:TolC family protein n=1 Tax=Sulfurivermis fontis TaxID=1972068 RepID=UPI000FDA56C6|nr:TolC family protein [Sulfurivermis fontis]
MSMFERTALYAALCLSLLCKSVVAQDAGEPLPDPLTLEQALTLAEELDPAMQQAQAAVDLARAGVLEAEARDGVNVWLEGRARWIEPADNTADDSRDDHKASLLARKNLYDFGRSSAQQAAAVAELDGSELIYLDSARQRKLEVMRRFFDVLRADMEFARDDEAMAVAYVTLDRLRNRHELGEVSDLEILTMENEYEQTRRNRTASENRMRVARAQLAIVLNRPGMLPSTLVRPELPQLQRSLPEYEQLLGKAMAENPRLQALRKRVEAARQRLEGAYAGRRPRISGELEASEYSRSMGSNDKMRASIYVEVPLYDGGSTQSAVARQQAELYRVQAELTEGERSLRQAVLELWTELKNLRVEHERVIAQRNFRDLYLDRSRALYEMEVQADLGDAMVRLTEAQLDELNVRFAMALAWERMDALTGGALPPEAAAVRQ